MDTPDYFSAAIWGLIFGFVAFVFAAIWFLGVKRSRQILDLPVSLIRSASQGRVALDGQARALNGHEILTPLGGTPCLWWEYSVTERLRNSDGGNSSRIVATGTSEELFELADETGVSYVDPRKAEVWFPEKRTWRETALRQPGDPVPENTGGGRFEYEELFIPADSACFAQGFFQTLRPPLEDRDINEDIARLLEEWKQDEAALSEFDHDGDGRISDEEWQAARREAIERVSHQHIRDAGQETHMLIAPPQGGLFLIAQGSRDEVIARMQSGCSPGCALAVALGTGALAIAGVTYLLAL